MTTPTRPDEHDRSEGQVRHLLWRLRARLVAPPREQQVEDDLSRLLEAARDNAHGSPSSYASDHPGPDASSRHPEFPLTATAGDELSARRAGRVASATFGRAAAASVAALVLGVGVSHAAGGPVTFDTFFGRDGQVIADEADPTVAAPVTDEPDDAGSGTGDDAVAEVEDLDAPELEALELPDDDASTSGEADTSEDTPAPSDDVGEVADEAEDTVDDVTDGEEAGEILAGPSDPPSDDLAGFSGGQQCEGDDLASCLPVADDEGGPTVDEGDEDTEAEDLASRRFRPVEDEDDPVDE